MQQFDVVIVGGGAAGFFTAINLAVFRADLRIAIMERGKEVLTKVKISGGGRCNVTHAEFLPQELIKNYPRGEKELRGPFHHFMTGDTMSWFEERGVGLKIEEDGRIFPESNDSQTIIECFLAEAKKRNIQVLKNHSLQQLELKKGNWCLGTNQGEVETQKLVLTTGSNPKIWKLLQNLGHQTITAVPSLFTFDIKDARIKNLPGIATPATVSVLGTKLIAEGPLLITHWGMSGPAILKLSAWGARELYERAYNFEILVNWLVDQSVQTALETLKILKEDYLRQQIGKYAQFDLPKRLWQSVLTAAGISLDTRWAELNNKQLRKIANELTEARFTVVGKSTFKEEFVTAGGVNLKEVDFKTFASKKLPNLYFAGEILNIDAITGGFNFQNAWTSGYLAARAIAEKDHKK